MEPQAVELGYGIFKVCHPEQVHSQRLGGRIWRTRGAKCCDNGAKNMGFDSRTIQAHGEPRQYSHYSGFCCLSVYGPHSRCLYIMDRNTSLGHQDLLVASSVPEALNSAANASPHGQIFILGGSSVYEEALKHPDCECVFLTRLKVHPDMPCDAFFPARELERYPICQKLTTRVFNILKSSLPKSSTIILNQPAQDVKEHEIRYDIVVYKK